MCSLRVSRPISRPPKDVTSCSTKKPIPPASSTSHMARPSRRYSRNFDPLPRAIPYLPPPSSSSSSYSAVLGYDCASEREAGVSPDAAVVVLQHRQRHQRRQVRGREAPRRRKREPRPQLCRRRERLLRQIYRLQQRSDRRR